MVRVIHCFSDEDKRQYMIVKPVRKKMRGLNSDYISNEFIMTIHDSGEDPSKVICRFETKIVSGKLEVIKSPL